MAALSVDPSPLFGSTTAKAPLQTLLRSTCSEISSLRSILLVRLNLFLAFVPLGLFATRLGISDAIAFALNGLAIVPLASMLSHSTEIISEQSGPIIGALLNCSFGNAVELLIAFLALQQELFLVVKASVVGGVLCNLLMVMGIAICVAGWKKRYAEFNAAGATATASALQVANLVLILPTIFAVLPKQAPRNHPYQYYSPRSHYGDLTTPSPGVVVTWDRSLEVSRADAILMLVTYVQFVYFQLKTHPELFMSIAGADIETSFLHAESEATAERSASSAISLKGAVCVLLLVTGVAAVTSDALVSSLNSIPLDPVKKEFLALILLPLIGQASEFASCLNAAQKGEMDLVLGIGVGSCCQTMLFVLPMTVLYGWYADLDMDMEFHPFDMVCLIFSTFLVTLVTQSGRVTWLHGSMLVTCYVAIAIMEFFMPSW